LNLTIDVGNTRTKLAIFDGDKLVERQYWDDWAIHDLLRFATNHRIKNVILCSVGRRLDEEAERKLGENRFLIQLEANTLLPVKNAYKTPQTLGKDRIAAVVGAFALFPGKNCLVVDAGSCITYDLLTTEGIYLGGNIAPGLRMRLRAMHEFTARLPEVNLHPVQTWIGDSTQSAMNNGALLGVLLEIEGYRQRWEKEWGQLTVILTGGDADFLTQSILAEVVNEPNLVFIGLNKILNHNVE